MLDSQLPCPWRRQPANAAAVQPASRNVETLFLGALPACRCEPPLSMLSRHLCLPACLQETLNNLRLAMRETRIMCAVMLDTKVGTHLPHPVRLGPSLCCLHSH